MSYCTERNFQVAPGVFAHDYLKEEVEAAEGCCQQFVCGIPCPAVFDNSGVALGFGVPVALVSCSWVVMGFVIALVTIKRDDYRGFFVCNRTLPLYIVAFALLSQGLDISSSLGNAVSSFKFSFWDGAVVPMGVGMSLILNSLLLAAPINRMGLLTLPDLFRRKYGALMEVIVSFIEIASFTVLLAGNLVGISLVLQFCFGLPKGAGVAISGVVLALYTASGGLYSVALTDIPQALGGLTGLLVTAVYMMVTEKDGLVPQPSKGFAVDLGGNVTARTPGYTGPADCLDPDTGQRTCDNFAYPIGDKVVYLNGMRDPDAYAPFPNAILYNWASIFVLGLGNLCALDFQARSIAAKCPRTARIANMVAGIVLLAVALPFGVLGGLARKYYGPDSPYAVFEADSCSAPLGRPSCAQWVPQENTALFVLLWEQVPRAIGAWAMVAMVAASVSTADGAILATATVAAHNLWRKVPHIGSNERNMLLVARIFIVPMTLLACATALLTYRTSYLLVISFDIVLAGVLVPLLAAVYAPNVSPNAGIVSCVVGSLLRIMLEQVMPKDGSLVAPLGHYALQYGRALPGLMADMLVDPPELSDAAGVWNPEVDTCDQEPLADWTGMDSLISPFISLLTMIAISLLEWRWPGTDILWFVPKAWRQATPLYLSEDASARPWSAKMSDLPAKLRRGRRHTTMPSVPEEEYYDTYDGGNIRGGGVDDNDPDADGELEEQGHHVAVEAPSSSGASASSNCGASVGSEVGGVRVSMRVGGQRSAGRLSVRETADARDSGRPGRGLERLTSPMGSAHGGRVAMAAAPAQPKPPAAGASGSTTRRLTM